MKMLQGLSPYEETVPAPRVTTSGGGGPTLETQENLIKGKGGNSTATKVNATIPSSAGKETERDQLMKNK